MILFNSSENRCPSLHEILLSIRGLFGVHSFNIRRANNMRYINRSLKRNNVLGQGTSRAWMINVVVIPSGWLILPSLPRVLLRDLLSPSSSENCVSTSAVNIPGKLGSPWEYALQTDDADRAFASLVQAVEASSDATMKMIDTKGLYLLAQFPSKERKMRYSIYYSVRILPYISDTLGPYRYIYIYILSDINQYTHS